MPKADGCLPPPRSAQPEHGPRNVPGHEERAGGGQRDEQALGRPPGEAKADQPLLHVVHLGHVVAREESS